MVFIVTEVEVDVKSVTLTVTALIEAASVDTSCYASHSVTHREKVTEDAAVTTMALHFEH